MLKPDGCRAPPRSSHRAAVAIAFFLNTSSYYGEIYRAGIESVGLGQWDAARSTGLRVAGVALFGRYGAFRDFQLIAHHTLAYVVLPQAVRNVLPDLVSNTVEVVKLTSIASVVAPIVLAAAIYLAMFGRWCG